MVDFRKWFVALALVVLTAATASAQTAAFACTASAGVPPLLRSEGLTEQTGDIVLNCTGGDPNVPIVANFQVFLNTNVTSRLIADPYFEAMLMINEPAPSAQILGTNIWQGRKISDSSENTIVWLGVPVIPPGSTGTRVIRMTGIRANASQLGVASGLIPTQVYAFISISGSTSVPLNNPQQTVGFIQSGLEFAVRDKDGGSIDQSERTLLQCKDNNKDLSKDPTDSDMPEGYSQRVRFNERFATAFKVQRVAGDQAAPGVIYNTESGYINSYLSGSNAATYQQAGLATAGTRLRAQFSNIPSGVRLYVSTTPVNKTGGNDAVFITSDPSGAGGSILAPPPGTGGASAAYIEIPIFNGVGTATWEINAADALQMGRVEFAILWAWAANQPGTGTATANGSYAPISSIGEFTGPSIPVPRFADTSSAINILELIQCRTSLLFPFVSNQAGFDTGMTIANTSKDSFSTATQSGTCTLNYYGNTNGGAAPPAQTTNTIPAGEHMAATLSGGGNFGVTATPGFQGYIIAVCQFQYAHGFAFISDVGAQRLAQGYVALVINGGQNRDAVKTGSSESLGQ